MLEIETFIVGRVYMMAVEDLLRHASGDLSHYYGEYEPGSAEYMARFERMLDSKRRDYDYQKIVDSIKEFGYVVSLNMYWDKRYKRFVLSDGHHRLAAAIDLGITVVPVKIRPRPQYRSDSISWMREGILGEDDQDN